jgi:hypothetical protein
MSIVLSLFTFQLLLVREGSTKRRAAEGPPMSDSDTRTQLYEGLRELSELMPEMRCAQLIAAIGELCADLHGRGLWDASDAEFLEALWQFRRNYEAATARSGSTRRSG